MYLTTLSIFRHVTCVCIPVSMCLRVYACKVGPSCCMLTLNPGHPNWKLPVGPLQNWVYSFDKETWMEPVNKALIDPLCGLLLTESSTCNAPCFNCSVFLHNHKWVNEWPGSALPTQYVGFSEHASHCADIRHLASILYWCYCKQFPIQLVKISNNRKTICSVLIRAILYIKKSRHHKKC